MRGLCVRRLKCTERADCCDGRSIPEAITGHDMSCPYDAGITANFYTPYGIPSNDNFPLQPTLNASQLRS
jgi:hypothetical protein